MNFISSGGPVIHDSRPDPTIIGGADGNRTHDLMNAIHALSQLSYGPTAEHFTIIRDKVSQ